MAFHKGEILFKKGKNGIKKIVFLVTSEKHNLKCPKLMSAKSKHSLPLIICVVILHLCRSWMIS